MNEESRPARRPSESNKKFDRTNAVGEATQAKPAERHAAGKRAELREIWKAIVLSPTLELCEALLRGESVPVERLDCEWVERLGRQRR